MSSRRKPVFLIGNVPPSVAEAECIPYYSQYGLKTLPGHRRSSPLYVDRSEHRLTSRVRGKIGGIPHLAKNERDTPDFLYEAPSSVRVCGFHSGKPHEVHERHQTLQEIRVWGTRPSSRNDPFGNEFSNWSSRVPFRRNGSKSNIDNALSIMKVSRTTHSRVIEGPRISGTRRLLP